MICTKLSKICGSREDVENEKKVYNISHMFIFYNAKLTFSIDLQLTGEY